MQQKEGLDNITDEDTEAFAQANGMTKDTLVSLYGEDTVKEQVLQDKVLRFLASNADNEAENPAKLSEREVTVTATETSSRRNQRGRRKTVRQKKPVQQRKLTAEETSEAAESTEAETTTEETKDKLISSYSSALQRCRAELQQYQ